MKEAKGLRSTNWQLQSIHRDVKYGIGDIVNNIVTTVRGARQIPEISGGTLCKVHDCLAQCYTSETNTKVILKINYN